jgi:hypothetical protein
MSDAEGRDVDPHVEQLLDGVDDGSLPASFQALLPLLAAARQPATAGELAREREMTEMFQAMRPAVRHVPASNRRRSLGIRIVAVAGLVTVSSATAAAAAGRLPEPVQQTAAAVLATVGISVPDPDTPAVDPPTDAPAVAPAVSTTEAEPVTETVTETVTEPATAATAATADPDVAVAGSDPPVASGPSGSGPPAAPAPAAQAPDPPARPEKAGSHPAHPAHPDAPGQSRAPGHDPDQGAANRGNGNGHAGPKPKK